MDVTHSESAFAFKRSSVRGALEGLEVSLHKVAVGSFCGRVRFVVRHGSDTLSQEAAMSVSKPLVGLSNRYRSPGSTSDPQESDVACGDLGESASQRGVSLSVILPAEGRHGALDEGAIGRSSKHRDGRGADSEGEWTLSAAGCVQARPVTIGAGTMAIAIERIGPRCHTIGQRVIKRLTVP